MKTVSVLSLIALNEQEDFIMTYVCNICGYVYDEAAEGVKWDDLGDDFVCPVCGVGKDDFSAE